MKIENEFGVDVPIGPVWAALSDLEGLAPCMPGAELTGVEGDVHRGRVRVKVGPVISQFTGTARFVEKDDTAHRAVISAAGKDVRGGGNASATIHAQLRPDGAGTHVSVSTDLTISGRLAQFGSGMIKEISEKLLRQFVHNLETRLHAPATEPAVPPAGRAAASPGAAQVAARPAPAASGAPEPAQATAPAEPPPVVALSELPPAASPSEPGRAGGPAPAPSRAEQGGPAAARAEAAPAATVRAAGVPVTERENAPLDLMELAGSSVYKRLIPPVLIVLVAIAVVVRLLVR